MHHERIIHDPHHCHRLSGDDIVIGRRDHQPIDRYRLMYYHQIYHY
jgi:hypothetical protein